MFIRLTKQVTCQRHFMYNREPFNQWSNEDDYRRTSTEDKLEAGKVFQAVRVQPSKHRAGCCEVYLDDDGDTYYTDVPWDCLEISDVDPNKPKQAKA